MPECLSAAGSTVRKVRMGELRKSPGRRTNKELVSCLHGMLEWLQDMNWPGAFCILERLKSLKKIPEFQCWYDTCMKCAKALEDEAWISNLEMLKEES